MDEKFRSAKKVDALTGVALEHFMDSHQTLESDCIALELTSSLATVRKIRAVLTGSDPTYSSLHSLHIELEGRLIDEAEAKVFLALNIREADIYNNPRKGWEEIVERFPDTVTDIEEASKCFALSRYAAAIFHSVQVVEVGLIGHVDETLRLLGIVGRRFRLARWHGPYFPISLGSQFSYPQFVQKCTPLGGKANNIRGLNASQPSR
jgi:hypothetical protein